MSDQFVSVRGLVYEYGVNRALDEVSFDLPAGSVTALVGPNGAGKTTLLRCLAGLERPLAGSVRIDGIDVLEQPRLAHAKLGFQQDFLASTTICRYGAICCMPPPFRAWMKTIWRRRRYGRRKRSA